MADLTSKAPNFDWDTASELSWRRFETHVQLMLASPLSGKTKKTAVCLPPALAWGKRAGYLYYLDLTPC